MSEDRDLPLEARVAIGFRMGRNVEAREMIRRADDADLDTLRGVFDLVRHTLRAEYMRRLGPAGPETLVISDMRERVCRSCRQRIHRVDNGTWLTGDHDGTAGAVAAAHCLKTGFRHVPAPVGTVPVTS